MASFDLGLQGFEQSRDYGLHFRTAKAMGKTQEGEIKLRAMRGVETFSDILANLKPLEFITATHTPTENVFLLSPNFYYKDYVLANYGLDTLEEKIHASGYLFRQRNAVRPWSPDPDAVFGITECTVKDEFSRLSSSMRLEIQAKTKGFSDAAAEFFADKADVLPGFFGRINPALLYLYAAFMTARSSYLIGVFLPERKITMAFEVCNDRTYSVLPDLSRIVKDDDFEWEAEAKKIYYMKGFLTHKFASPKLMTPQEQEKEKTAIFLAAEDVLRDWLKGVVPAGDLIPNRKSKLERVVDAINDYYSCEEGNAWHRGTAQSPFANGLAQELDLAWIERNKEPQIIALAQQVMSAYDLVNDNIPGIQKVKYETEFVEPAAVSARQSSAAGTTKALRMR